MDVDLTIRGIQAVLADNNRRIAALQPNGTLGRIVKDVLIFTHAEAVKVTHKDTGALQNSHRMMMTGAVGRVFIDPDSVNPRSRQKPAEYGEFEMALGGGHAFYRLAREAGQAHFRNLVRQTETELAK